MAHLQDWDVLRVQWIWTWTGRRQARTIMHAQVNTVGGDFRVSDVAEFYAVSMLGNRTDLLADGCTTDGCRVEVIHPLPPSDVPANRVHGHGPTTVWSTPYLQWWGARLLMKTTSNGEPRGRYDPWMVIPFTPRDEVINTDGVLTVSDAYLDMMEVWANTLSSEYYVPGVAGDGYIRTVRWNRVAQSTTDVIAFDARDDRLRHVRRRNVFWRELSWP